MATTLPSKLPRGLLTGSESIPGPQKGKRSIRFLRQLTLAFFEQDGFVVRELRNMEDLIALYKTEGRFPSTKGRSSPPGAALAMWLQRRRQDANRGSLSPIYREGLKAIPGWDQQPSRKAKDEARWQQRLTELMDYMAAGNDWPRHRKTDSDQERTLGVWLHGMKHRAGDLEPEKEDQMNHALHGWQTGRTRGGKPLP